MIEEFVVKLHAALAGELPGFEAHRHMMSYQRPNAKEAEKTVKNVRYASVLISLYEHRGEIYTSLMLRPKYRGVHSAQVSFPGGARENEETPEETALRESHEELGIVPEKVKVIGRLSQVFIPPSRYLVTPVVGYLTERPNFDLDPFEVEELIEVPLLHLFDDKVVTQHKIDIPTKRIRVLMPCYLINQHIIWGATAMMVSEFKQIHQQINRINLRHA